ncbi:MAG: hypothetical protein HQL25_01175 [Candidatus Omnitrophica bacterium]|nr:hypothetical protein [Candidatus Omnitrophota bacterium]
MLIRIICKYWFVFVIPTIMAGLLVLLKISSGPYWQNVDPSYAYLFNSLNLVKGLASHEFFHPGTTVQILALWIFKIMNLGHTNADIVNRVLSAPEYYLNLINIFMVVSFCLLSAAFAAYVFRKTTDWIAAVLTQIPLLAFLVLKSFDSGFPIPTVVVNVSPDPMLICVGIIYNWLLLNLYFSKTGREEFWTVFWLGIIGGMGLATRLTFFPLLIVPLILISWRKKSVFIVLCVASFVAFTLPVLKEYRTLWYWINALSFHTGVYASGKNGFIDFSSFFINLKIMFIRYWFFMLFGCLVWVWSSWKIFKRDKAKGIFFLWSISFSVLLQFMMVAKHFSHHYMLIGISLFSSLLFLYYLTQMAKYKIGKVIAGVFIVIFSIFFIVQSFIYSNKAAVMNKEILEFRQNINSKYDKCVSLGYYGQPVLNPEYALFFGNFFSGLSLKEELSKIYPKYLYFNRDYYRIYNFKDVVFADDLLPQVPCVIFVGNQYDFTLGPYSVELLEQGKYANVYGLVSSNEKFAQRFADIAIKELQSGNFVKALQLALQSKKLKFFPQHTIDGLISEIVKNIKN